MHGHMAILMIIMLITHATMAIVFGFVWLGGIVLARILDDMPCVVLWRPDAIDCRVLIPPETWNGFTRNRLATFESQTS